MTTSLLFSKVNFCFVLPSELNSPNSYSFYKGRFILPLGAIIAQELTALLFLPKEENDRGFQKPTAVNMHGNTDPKEKFLQIHQNKSSA